MSAMTVLTHPTASRIRTDAELVAGVRAGRPDAFDALVKRYERALTTWARSLLHGAHHDAEEVVQDVLVKALAALRQDERPMVLKPWLYAICRNACLDRLRAARSRPTTELALVQPLLADPGADPHGRAVGREELAALVAQLGTLPARQRIALVGLELEGRSHEQLASGLGVTVGGSKALVCRARRGLAEARAAA
jgi:RNA polymerase sigma-70 factor, ECF subfamily